MLIGFFGIFAGCLVLIVNPYDLLFKFKINLSHKGEIFELWRNPPVELYLKVYLFNVTNREAFLSGAEKLRVQEVGPYVYREFMEHTNVSFNSNGTMSMSPSHPLKWVPEMSNGKEDDILVLPNIALLSFANVMLNKPFLSQMAVNLWIRQTDSQPLVEMTAREFMFGYKSTFVTVGSRLLPNWIIFDKLGLIDRMYDFQGDVSTVYTGDTDLAKAGLLATYNRSPKLPHWDLPCGQVNDSSDGTKFPSFIHPNDSLLFYRKSMCRSMPLVRKGNETSRNGLKGYQYHFQENALDNGAFNEKNKCFCRNGKCLPRGLIDVTDCYYGFPIALSYPHFYLADPTLVNAVEGSYPNPEQHETYFVIQPETGLPLEVAVRMQINMAFGDLSPMARVGRFKHMVLPLLWTESRMTGLPPDLSVLFKMYINILPTVQHVAIYLLFTGGAAFFFVAIIKLLRSSSRNQPGNYAMNCQAQKITTEEKELKSIKSPQFNSRDVISDIIDEGKQVIFGKKKPKIVKANQIYKETTKRRSSFSRMMAFLRKDKGRSKSEIYDGKKAKEDSTEVTLLKNSTESETNSSSPTNQDSNPFFEAYNRNFSDTEGSLMKLLNTNKNEVQEQPQLQQQDETNDNADDFESFQVDLSILDNLKEDVV
ncbi:hypothetical protein RUM43_001263 [Polyplax serrata]|uniref:Scavenger receptor class B member 1 n=1 Tax=Polyplax serrata TaxID=468196 RepID=A0AAN8SE42_POLSC